MSSEEESEAGKSGFRRRTNSPCTVSLASSLENGGKLSVTGVLFFLFFPLKTDCSHVILIYLHISCFGELYFNIFRTLCLCLW